MEQVQLMRLAANTVRTLSTDAIQKAKSGHPGLPLGAADFAFVLYYKYLRHNPQNPNWLGRDRFILSAGHGSMLQYSLLHMFNYDLSIDDIKNFRQLGSKTAGHPEYRLAPGVEITTGPLGSGFASGVGMAASLKHFNAVTGMDKVSLFDSKIYILCGDGCLMEGCSYEAASLAGHLKLDNIVVFFDSNAITIEGKTNLTFSEDMVARFESCNWRVLTCENANDIEQCDAVLAEAQKSDGRPTLIIGKTTIGYGAPTKAGTSGCHGAPLGEDEIVAMKENLGVSPEKFYVPAEVKELCTARTTELANEAAEWDKAFSKLLDFDKSLAARVEAMLNPVMPDDLEKQLLQAAPVGETVATRVASNKILQKVSDLFPSVFGGAADVGPSSGAVVKDGGDFSADNYAGKNFHFGIRELSMGLIANGIALSGMGLAFSSTFFVFSDYMKPAIRLAALMSLHELYIFSHDSFHVGEDGATHEPIEHMTMLRTIPGLVVIRPADAAETALAYAVALRMNRPVALLLSRQNLAPLPGAIPTDSVMKGAYVISEDSDFEYILVATGSEVAETINAADMLRADGKKVRVVSMPSQELFNEQSAEYKNSILPKGDYKIVTVEAGSTICWHKIAGSNGLNIGLDHYGESAPANVLMEKYGFTAPQIYQTIKEYFA